MYFIGLVGRMEIVAVSTTKDYEDEMGRAPEKRGKKGILT
jgi:hypothetical protein